MKKYEQVAQLLRRRIEEEDYGHQTIPGARRVAEETGVSYITALKALQHLVNCGWAVRADNGRLEAKPQETQAGKIPLRVAFLSPARQSNYFVWENAVQRAALKLDCSFRLVPFTHQEDPVITEVITGTYDVVFLSHSLTEGSYVRELAKRHRDKIVSLFHDLTSEGIRCLDGPTPQETDKLVEHLYRLGHRSFASLTVGTGSGSARDKNNQWDKSVRQRGCENNEYSRMLKPFEFVPIPAYDLATSLLDNGELAATAVFAPTLETAISIIRAAHDRGLAVGKDISVCSFGQPEMARMHLPSITIIDRPDPTPQAEAILRQYLSGKSGRRMFRPDEGKLILGESTGPAPRPSRRRA